MNLQELFKLQENGVLKITVNIIDSEYKLAGKVMSKEEAEQLMRLVGWQGNLELDRCVSNTNKYIKQLAQNMSKEGTEGGRNKLNKSIELELRNGYLDGCVFDKLIFKVNDIVIANWVIGSMGSANKIYNKQGVRVRITGKKEDEEKEDQEPTYMKNVKDIVDYIEKAARDEIWRK